MQIIKISLIIAVVALSCVCLLLFNWSKFSVSEGPSPSEQRTISTKVITQPITMTPNNRVFETVGTGRAQLSADIYPAVAEEVTTINFTAGQQVQRGDVLVQLDDREEKLAVRAAAVRLKDARSLLTRFENAGNQGAVPQSQVDGARADFEVAEVTLEQAEFALQERQIESPFTGVVGIPRVDEGDRVTAETLITGLDNRQVIQIDFNIPEALAGRLQDMDERPTVLATTPAYPNQPFPASIKSLQSRVEPIGRTLMVRAEIDNEDDVLRPGMSFNIKWNIDGELYATVPEIALQWSKDGSYVWIVRNGKASKVMAKVIARKAGIVLLDGDLAAGEDVVIEGLQRLRPDVPVDVIAKGAL